jgi:hypothetical protein
MTYMNSDQEENHHYHRVDYDGAQGVDIADPPAAQTLDTKLLEKTDSGADENGVQNGENARAAIGAARQTGERRENRNRQQDRSELAARGNRHRIKR